MKKLILLSLFILGGLLASAQCVTPSNLGTQTTVDGSQLYLYWNTAGATEYKFIPLNFNALWYGQTVATWYGSGWSVGGIVIDTVNYCNTTIQWQIENYCFTHTGNETLDTTNADKSYSAVQSYFIPCTQNPPTPIIFNYNGHTFKRHGH